mmetsp:Transcript_7229/g.10116  ORF Transcript_7229/g.10116 Transcript_7229/m.10116 type:complete len:267 (+) Transcript_7229:261-1061(+)
MSFAVEPRLCFVKLFIEERVLTMEVLGLVIAIDLEHVFAPHESFPAVAHFSLLVGAILLIEGRILARLVLAELGLALGSPLSVCLRPVPILFELIELRVIFSALAILLLGPLVVAIRSSVFVLRLRILAPLLVVVGLAVPTLVPRPRIELGAPERVVAVEGTLPSLVLLASGALVSPLFLLVSAMPTVGIRFVKVIAALSILAVSALLILFCSCLFRARKLRVEVIKVVFLLKATVEVVILGVAAPTLSLVRAALRLFVAVATRLR